jgi:hypothetical protein
MAGGPEIEPRGMPHHRTAGRGGDPRQLSRDLDEQEIPAAELPARVGGGSLAASPRDKRVLFSPRTTG